MHLGMSGSLGLVAETLAPGPHDHFDLHTSAGLLRLTDPRRFGAVVWSAALDADPPPSCSLASASNPLTPAFDGLAPAHAWRGRRAWR